MTLRLALGRALQRTTDAARVRVALRGATRTERGVRVFGWPSVVNEGHLRIGARVLILSTPAAVTLVVERGGSIEIGDDAILESGVTVRARRRIVIGRAARLGAGCVIDDSQSDAPELSIDAGAQLADGVIVDGSSSLREGLRPGAAVGRDATAERVRAVMADIVAALATVDGGLDLRGVEGWDSLAALRVVVALEKELGVQLPYDLFAAPRTLDSVVAMVRGEGAS